MKMPLLPALALCSALLSPSQAQVPSHALTSSEWKTAATKVSEKAIPGYAFGFTLEPRQSFAFGSGGASFWVVPVTYAATDPGAGGGAGPSQQCGLFTLLPNGSVGFAEVFGKHEPSMDGESAQTNCVAVKGVSFVARPSGQAPLLLLAVEADTMFRPGVSDDTVRVFVCSWNPGTKIYARDPAIEARLTNAKGMAALPKTFAEARARLKATGS